jgi:hypothetical protein
MRWQFAVSGLRFVLEMGDNFALEPFFIHLQRLLASATGQQQTANC